MRILSFICIIIYVDGKATLILIKISRHIKDSARFLHWSILHKKTNEDCALGLIFCFQKDDT